MKKFLLAFWLTLIACAVFAQVRTITGSVTSSEDGSAMPGVNIVIKGTTNGTVTGTDGKYSVDSPAAGATLVFSFIGMETAEIQIGDRTSVNVTMKIDVTQLEEVVVNAIGETRSEDKMGVASSTIAGNAVAQSGEPGLVNGLAGKAPGMIITRNGGDPGAGAYIQLRGQSTITGDLQPLIVIDGMPMFNSTIMMASTGGTQQQSRLNDINPADIASIEVIKSAAGAALWGSRAANGVIVITTKKGKNSHGKLSVTYTGTVSFDKVNKMPKLQRQFGQGAGGLFSTGTSASYGDQIETRPGGSDPLPAPGAPYIVFPDGTIRGNIAAGTNPSPHGGKASTDTYDHTKDAFQTGHFVEHGLSISSGGDRTQFYASYSNLSQEGVIRQNSDYNKNVARVNLRTAITDKLTAGVNVNFSNVRSNRIQQGSNTSGLLLGAVRTAPDFNNEQYIGTAIGASGGIILNKEVSYRNPIGANATPGYDNPYWTINKNKSFSVVNRFLGNFELNYDPTEWLNFKANAGVDTYADRRTDFTNAQSQASLGGSYSEQYFQESQWNANLYGNAKKKFSDFFAGSILVGFNYNNRQFNNVGATVTNFIIPDAPPNLINSPSSNRTPFNAASTIRTSAAFTEINGEFADQIFITLTGRAESASTFGPLAKSLFYYPSASAAWQFSKVTGTNNFFSFGKLRASYGIVGKQPDPYLNLTQFVPQNFTDSFGPTLTGSSYGVGGYAISNVAGNQRIRPEKKHETEVGLDLRFFEDKITFGATAFYNKTTDAILQTQVAPTSGYTNTIANAGSIENKGAELSLGATWVKLKNGFTWNTNLIWSAYRNKVLDLAGSDYVILSGFVNGSSAAAKGKPLGVIYGTGYTYDAGNLVLDANGFPTVDPNLVAVGNPNPKYRASAANTFGYKGFTLYALFEFSVGGQMWNGTEGAMFNFGTSQQTASRTTVSAADAANLKTYDGKTIASLAAAGSARVLSNADGSYTFRGTVKDFGSGNVALDEKWYTGAGNGFNVVSPFVQDATWSRLRELTLSYTINTDGFRSFTKLQSVTFGVTGRNLFLWTPYRGIDPDTNLTGPSNGRGLDYFQNPNTRSVLAKLTVNF
ncbi:MAG: SusC/RagA family TonB-linked outer membrane protein [Chryseolinea sp.]